MTCEHGQLERQRCRPALRNYGIECPLCERDAEIARLLDRIKEATHVAAVHYSTLIHARAEQRMTIADRDRLAAENERLREALEQASHSDTCPCSAQDWNYQHGDGPPVNLLDCQCWKRAALGEE